MRFLLDENVDARLAAHLRAGGHDAVSTLEDPGAGASDAEVLATALRGGRVLITNDTDFGELILRRGLSHAGVVLLRLRTTAIAAQVAALEMVIREHSSRLAEFLVVTESRVRVRRARR